MSTHNIYIRREVRKILCGYPLLSVAMYKNKISKHFGLKNLPCLELCGVQCTCTYISNGKQTLVKEK